MGVFFMLEGICGLDEGGSVLVFLVFGFFYGLNEWEFLGVVFFKEIVVLGSWYLTGKGFVAIFWFFFWGWGSVN